jgi:hypothetical protein
LLLTWQKLRLQINLKRKRKKRWSCKMRFLFKRQIFKIDETKKLDDIFLDFDLPVEP